jgi:hypothetical protein
MGMTTRSRIFLMLMVAAGAVATASPGAAGAGESVPLTPEALKPVGVDVAAVEYRGRAALRLTEKEGLSPDADSLAVMPGLVFGDGTIEVEVAGAPRAGTFEGARGFIGVAFHLQDDPSRYECLYIRPTNGRAEDQLRRNHSTQYVSHPDFPWYRLRKESPGVYESYVDLVVGEWTPLKIVVSGTEARLFVHDADEPCLIVKDLKLGAVEGAIALWIGAGTEGYFTNLRATR